MNEQIYPSYLIHYGIEGQKWGIRRWQNEDGTWTSEGLERRRQLIEEGGSKREIKKAKKEGKLQVKLNKELYREQEKLGKKFDKKTEKILQAREKGKHISRKKIDKVTSLGTQYRMMDYVSKNPKKYYDIKKEEKSVNTRNALKSTAFIASCLTLGIGYMSYDYYNKEAAIQKAYKKELKKARNLTMSDLKQHGVIK